MDDLREKIKDSEVKVEINSHNSNLADMLNKVRHQYDELAEKNLKDAEDWYQNKVPAAAPVALAARSSPSVSPPSLSLRSLTASKWRRPKTTRPCCLERRT